MSQWMTYSSSTSAVTSPADTGDWFQLRNGAAVTVEILEIQVFQHVETTLVMNALELRRGTGGAGGTGMTEDEWQTLGTTPLATAFSLPTTDVGTADLTLTYGWNILQPFVWLPTPEIYLHLKPSDHLGIAAVVADSIAGVGCNIIWRELR